MEIIISQNELNPNISIKEQENQLLYVDGGGNVIGISDVLVNGNSVVNNGIAYVIVPTKTSELMNDSGFITNELDPTVPYYVKQISIADINNWNNKQNALVSGANIKTINNNSLLGSGNIDITGNVYTAGTGISIDSNNIITNEIISYNDLTDLPTIPSKTSDLVNDNDFVSDSQLSEVAFTGSYTSLSDTPDIPTDLSELDNDVGFITNSVNDLTYYTKTADLPVIPTVNNGSLIIQINGTTVNTFTANSSIDVTTNITVPTTTNDLTNNSGFITKTDFATNSTGGTVITSDYYGVGISSEGQIRALSLSLAEYNDISSRAIISKGTLGHVLSEYTKTSTLSSVATSGNYNDLSNKPYDNQTYSTTETRIGTWINGKPLYRKVYEFTLTSSGYTFSSYSLGLSNVDKIYISGNSFIQTSNNTFYQINIGRYQSNTFAYNNEYSWFRCNRTDVNYSIGDTLAGGTCYLIVEYTKTTD